MQIKFQTALITCSSRGLGRQIALKLASEGARKIAIHYRTGRSDAETIKSWMESAGASGVLVQGDVGVMGQTPQELQDAVREWVESGWTTPMLRRGTGGYCRCLCAAVQR